MKLIIYALIVFILTFILQTFLIITVEKKKRKKLTNITIEDEYNRNNKIVIRILMALILSMIFAILSFYVIGFSTL